MKDRPLYMKTLLEFRDKSAVKVVTGIRRCGKSTLLRLFSDRLLESGVARGNIIEMNFESMRFSHITNHVVLYDEVRRSIAPSGKTYIILDEVQMVPGWEKAVNSFQVDFDADIYITGSNAYLLSSELSTLLSGRYVEIKMLPLSFREFLDFNAFDPTVAMDQRFQTYLKYGGMPAVSEYGLNEQRINDMLEGVYSTVILKDVLARNNVGDQAMLRKIVLFLADNVGNITSPNSISNLLVDEGDIEGGRRRKSPASRTVESYILSLQNAFIFYGIKRYDVRGKSHLKTLGKHYIVDTGIRNMLLGYRDLDRGRILENVVFLELMRRGYRVSIGKVDGREVDFIAEKPDDKVYYQVTETMAGEDVRARELTPLRDIQDNYEKVVLSMDRDFVKSYEGIRMKNIVDFLLEG